MQHFIGERFALVFEDGSISVMADGTTEGGVRRERYNSDSMKAAIVRLQVETLEIVDDPSAPKPADGKCPSCGRPT